MGSYYYDLINQRTSRRDYRETLPSGELLAEITRLLAQNTTGPLGTGFTFQLIDRDDMERRKIKLGTYGFIQGARFFIAGQCKPGDTAFLDYGFVLEKIILELTALGLGTCWLGGTFDRGEFGRAVGRADGYSIPAVTPVGFPKSTRGIGDQIIRLSAGSRNRLPWKDLFFSLPSHEPVTPAKAGNTAPLFEAVRLAPSASNKQPWRIYQEGSRFHFCLCRTPGYVGKYLPVDLQLLDMGIAMCHWDLVARENNFPVNWIHDQPESLASGPEYLITANTV